MTIPVPPSRYNLALQVAASGGIRSYVATAVSRPGQVLLAHVIDGTGPATRESVLAQLDRLAADDAACIVEYAETEHGFAVITVATDGLNPFAQWLASRSSSSLPREGTPEWPESCAPGEFTMLFAGNGSPRTSKPASGPPPGAGLDAFFGNVGVPAPATGHAMPDASAQLQAPTPEFANGGGTRAPRPPVDVPPVPVTPLSGQPSWRDGAPPLPITPVPSGGLPLGGAPGHVRPAPLPPLPSIATQTAVPTVEASSPTQTAPPVAADGVDPPLFPALGDPVFEVPRWILPERPESKDHVAPPSEYTMLVGERGRVTPVVLPMLTPPVASPTPAGVASLGDTALRPRIDRSALAAIVVLTIATTALLLWIVLASGTRGPTRPSPSKTTDSVAGALPDSSRAR